MVFSFVNQLTELILGGGYYLREVTTGEIKMTNGKYDAVDLTQQNVSNTAEAVVMFDFKRIGEIFEAIGDGWEYRGVGNRSEFIQHKKLPSIRVIKTLVKKRKST